ncbi:MAG: ASKHA domain-containing protein [Gemmatimonadales bacterium]|nr:ASKHA domain-containing protein [Gemmatimonadales bacterium]
MTSGSAFLVTIDGRTTTAVEGTSLFECAEALDVRVPTSCVKQGKCRECLVEVDEGAELLSDPAPQEAHLEGRFRLSCRARLAGSGGSVRCHTLRRGALRIETETRGLVRGGVLDPAVGRADGWVTLDGRPIVEGDGPIHGVAVDVGTTTVALRLYDLDTGALVATQSFENPQRFGGSDIMARIRYDGDHAGRLLQRTLLGYLGHALEGLPVDPATIYEIVVVGNPTMRDLLFGLDVGPIGQLPYRSVTEAAVLEGRAATTAIATTGARLRLPVHPAARVYGLPLIGSHVGADAAACVVATGLAESDEVTAIMDIGTNTEIVLGNRHRIMAASCPAGPAFEGGGISCGMPALDGAVERVRLGSDGAVGFEVVGGGAPVGICGSGLVDLVSELRRTDRINEQGRFGDDEESFRFGPDGALALSEADLNELAQAKGANVAGLRIVAACWGIPVADIARIDLAGGFSRHLDLDAARRIGLLPSLPTERLRQVGNAALEGAALTLLSVRRRRELESLVRRIEHVRLEADPGFFDAFVDGCQFVPFGAG